MLMPKTIIQNNAMSCVIYFGDLNSNYGATNNNCVTHLIHTLNSWVIVKDVKQKN